MPEQTDRTRHLLESLLRRVAKSSKGNQAILAVDAPKQSFRWIGSVGQTETGEPMHIPLLLQSIKGIYSTTADMMTFLRRLMQGELFENPETLTAMMSRWRRFGFPMDRAALRSPNWPIEYAIGMMRFRVPRFFTPFRTMPDILNLWRGSGQLKSLPEGHFKIPT